jgi:site-specific recombinase XerD
MLKAAAATHKVPSCMAFLICALRWAPSEHQKNDPRYLHLLPLQANAPIALLYLRARGDDHAQRANRLEQASAHWLRHSAGSHMADRQVDLRLVRDNLGHASLTTTSQYLYVDDDRRHRETDGKHRIDW